MTNIQETIQRLESKGWTKHADAVRELVRERDYLKKELIIYKNCNRCGGAR